MKTPTTMSPEREGDDSYYLRRLSEVLDSPPNQGPPAAPSQLTAHMWVGTQDNADDHQLLEHLSITSVLNVAGTRTFDLRRSPYPKDSCVSDFLMIPAQDHDHYDILQHFADAWAFVDRAREKRGRVLIHCNLGINRSGAIAAACLMLHERCTLLTAAQMLKNKRSVVLCNTGFRRQLIKFARVRNFLDPYSAMQQEADKNYNSGMPAKEVVRYKANGEAYENGNYCSVDERCSREASLEIGDVRNGSANGSDVSRRSLLSKVVEKSLSPRASLERRQEAISRSKNKISDYSTNGTGNRQSKGSKHANLSSDLVARIYRYIKPSKPSNSSDEVSVRTSKRPLSASRSFEAESEVEETGTAEPEVRHRVARRYHRSNTSDGMPSRSAPRPHSYCMSDEYDEEYQMIRPGTYTHRDVSPICTKYKLSASSENSPVIARRSTKPTFDISQYRNLPGYVPSDKRTYHNTTGYTQYKSTSSAMSCHRNGTTAPKHQREYQSNDVIRDIPLHMRFTNSSNNHIRNQHGTTPRTATTSTTNGCSGSKSSVPGRHNNGYLSASETDNPTASDSNGYIKPYRKLYIPESKNGPLGKMHSPRYDLTNAIKPYTYAMHQLRQQLNNV